MQSAQALALTEQGGWSGGGQYESSLGKARQQRGISGDIHDKKSSSHDAAGEAMYVWDGVRAALATCRDDGTCTLEKLFTAGGRLVLCP